MFDCRGASDALRSDVWTASGRTWSEVIDTGLRRVTGPARMSVTLNPASFEARPLPMMAGDLRGSLDRGKWPWSSGYHTPQLHRALEHLPRGETGARRIIGPPPKVRRIEGGFLVYDEFVAASPRHRPGAIDHSPSAGRIISVR